MKEQQTWHSLYLLEDTSRFIYAVPRDSVDSVEQGVHILSEDDTANSVVSVTIFPKNTNFITKIRNSLNKADDDNANNLVLNADIIISDPAVEGSGQSGSSTHQGQGGAGERKVLLF